MPEPKDDELPPDAEQSDNEDGEDGESVDTPDPSPRNDPVPPPDE